MLFPLSNVKWIRSLFSQLYLREEFVTDKTGSKVVELVNASFIADEDSIFGSPSSEWHNRELEWYLSQSLSVYDIPEPIPKIWKSVADKDGFINSNYGWCIFSEENGYQFDNVVKTLKSKPDSRQAIMIYNRPTMHSEWNHNGRSDFMCCQNTHHFIRDNQLISFVNFRSSDAIFGYKGDKFWMDYVANKLHQELLVTYPDLQLGPLVWNAGSIHIYERHFHLIEKNLPSNEIRNNNHLDVSP